jgi:hypothetical protein
MLVFMEVDERVESGNDEGEGGPSRPKERSEAVHHCTRVKCGEVKHTQGLDADTCDTTQGLDKDVRKLLLRKLTR